MAHHRTSPETIQHEFYSATADQYDSMHVVEDDEHHIALNYIAALMVGFGWTSALDVGAGTGRGLRYFRDAQGDIAVRGVEPVRAMIDHAERHNGVPEGSIIQASGDALPFADESFDVVFETGILHHVAEPGAIVSEMTRVARHGVFLSDANRFAGNGRMHRAAEFTLYRLGLWTAAYRLVNRGRNYQLNPGDGGVVYSYSVYDALPALGAWADRTFLIPTAPAPTGWFHPLFGARTALLCAIRDGWSGTA